jgi:hypothetical protein
LRACWASATPDGKRPAELGQDELLAWRGPQQRDDLAGLLDEEVVEGGAAERDAGHPERQRGHADDLGDAGAQWPGPALDGRRGLGGGHELGHPNELALAG